MSRTIEVSTNGKIIWTCDPTIQPNPPHIIRVDIIEPEPEPKEVWRDCKSEIESKWGEGVIERLQDKSYRRGGNCAIVALSLVTGRDPFILQQNAFKNKLMHERKAPHWPGVVHTGCRTDHYEHVEAIIGSKSWGQVKQILTRDMGKSDRRGMQTLNQFTKRYPKGRFYVSVRDHAVAVIDGVVYDYEHAGKRRIIGAWQIL